jgi:hypothetical protein
MKPMGIPSAWPAESLTGAIVSIRPNNRMAIVKDYRAGLHRLYREVGMKESGHFRSGGAREATTQR